MAELNELIGQILDEKYHLDQLLDQGGMGAVFLATHLGTTRPVALKIIAPQLMANEEFVERFRREAEAAGRLRHPNVVNVTDFGFAWFNGEQMAYLVMEYLNGSTLGSHLETGRPLALNFVVDVVEQVCLAIEKAHEHGIIHRDLKPDNIWLEPDGRGRFIVKVLDFGLAKLRDVSTFSTTDDPVGRNASAERMASLSSARRQLNRSRAEKISSVSATEAGTLVMKSQEAEVGEAGKTLLRENVASGATDASESATLHLSKSVTEPDELPDELNETATLKLSNGETKHGGGRNTVAAAGLTHAGEILGTPLYMSPEQCCGQPLDVRSDIYSLGVITWQMLAGEPMFSGTVTQLITRHTSEPAPSLREKRRDIPPAVGELVMASVSKNPDERPSSALSFASSLRATAEGEVQVLRDAKFHYTNLFPLMLRLSLIIYLPFILLTILLNWVAMPERPSATEGFPMQPYLVMAGLWLVTLALIVIAGRFKNAVCSLVADQLRSRAHHEIRLRSVLSEFFLHLPALCQTLLLSLGDVLSGTLRLIYPGWKKLAANSLAPTIVALEGRTGRDALNRSAELVSRLPHLANSFQVREVGGALLATVLMPFTMSVMGLVLSAPVEAMLYPSVGRRIFFAFFAWYFAVFSQAYSSAFPQALLYFRARRAGGESVDEITSQTMLAEKKAQRLRKMSLATINWILIPILMTLIILAYPLLRHEQLSLVHLIREGRIGKVHALLSQNADVNERSVNQSTALMFAVRDHHTELTRLLLSRGAAVNAADGDGETALFYAVRGGSLENFRTLMAAGADINHQNKDGETALMQAVRRERRPFVELLVASGAKLSLRDATEKTALSHAESEGMQDIVELLKKADATR